MQENIKAEEETPAGLDALFEEDEFEALPERKKRKKPSGNFFRSRKFRKNLFVICMLAYPVFQIFTKPFRKSRFSYSRRSTEK